MNERDDTSVFIGSGNVFADLGLPNPEERQVKARLAMAISDAIDARGITQTAAAALVGLKQPDISNILRGRLREYSVERLLRVLNALDQDVTIIVRPKRGDTAVTTVEQPAAD